MLRLATLHLSGTASAMVLKRRIGTRQTCVGPTMYLPLLAEGLNNLLVGKDLGSLFLDCRVLTNGGYVL